MPQRTGKPKRHFNLRLTATQHRKLKALAGKARRSMNEWLADEVEQAWQRLKGETK